MSQKILKMCVLILLIFLSLNLAKVNSKAVSHGCKILVPALTKNLTAYLQM